MDRVIFLLLGFIFCCWVQCAKPNGLYQAKLNAIKQTKNI